MNMLPTPDAAQSRLLEADLSERRVVVAGPGSGKTTTGIHLVVAAAREFDDQDKIVLYVSFSRAAMSAAFKAFESSDIGSIDVLAMTLDSLAWQIVGEDRLGRDENIVFDQVVKSASRKIGSDYQGEFDDVVHLIVDEAQDLSAVRRELLCLMIDNLPKAAGLTIFGDPLQSIYDLDDEAGRLGDSAWNLLIKDLASRDISKQYSLGGSHRALRRGPRLVANCSDELRSVSTDSQMESLDELLSDLSSWDLDEFIDRSSTWAGTTAILVRKNAEALWLFTELTDRGVACNWSEPGRARPRISSWVGELWNFVGGNPVEYQTFLEFANGRPDIGSSVFKRLIAECESFGAVSWLDFSHVLSRATDPTAPWFTSSSDGITISTIHQSKGLEWDNVAVVGPGSLIMGIGKRPPEIELLFVALSRARYRIVGIDWIAPFARRARGSGLVYSSEIATRRLTGVGIMPSAIGAGQVDRNHGQDALSAEDSNFAVEFDLLSSPYADWPIYRCRVADRAVGVTTELFGRALVQLVGQRAGGWPALGAVRSDGVETEFSHSPQLHYWVKPRPFGMAKVTSN